MKKRICASRKCPRLLPSVAEKEKPQKENLRIETEKLEKKKVSASRFMLAPSAKFEIKKKEPKIVVWERRGCFLFAQGALCCLCRDCVSVKQNRIVVCFVTAFLLIFKRKKNANMNRQILQISFCSLAKFLKTLLHPTVTDNLWQKKTNKIDQQLMLTVLVWLYLPTGEVSHSSGKKTLV